MTTYRRTSRAGLVRNVCHLPIVFLQLAAVVFLATHGSARSAYKGTEKRISRARRRRTNRKATTHDVATYNSMPKTTERNQLESHFLKLPLELRQQVYELHFKQVTLVIHELNIDRGSYKLHATRQEVWRSGTAREPNRLMQLPLTCRHIYCETIEYIYKKNTFKFGSHEKALLLSTLAIFPQKHLDTLRSLHLEFCIDILVKDLGLGEGHESHDERDFTPWNTKLSGQSKRQRKWGALWTFLASLPNLQQLHVAFKRLPGPDSFSEPYVFRRILAPLVLFNESEHLAVFEVEWQQKGWRLPENLKKDMPLEMIWK